MHEMSPAARRTRELGIVPVVRTEKADDTMMRAIRAVVAGGVGAAEAFVAEIRKARR